MNTGNIQEAALITGASSGIGQEMAELFAKDRFPLILVARSRERLEAVAAKLKKQWSVDIVVIPQDLSEPNACEKVFATVNNAGIKVGYLVNNAGFAVTGSYATTEWKQEQEMIRVHVEALSRMTKLFLPQMIERGHGRILNTASMAAFRAGPFMAVYHASKAYVLSFGEAINEELRGSGVTVTTLCPGPTRTRFLDQGHAGSTRLNSSSELMNASDVAFLGYYGMMRRKSVVIAGLKSRLAVLLVRFLPRSLATRMSGRVNSVSH